VIRPVAVAVGAAAAGLLWQDSALADRSEVVILCPSSADGVVQRAETRLSAELRAAGFAVEQRVLSDASDVTDLTDATDLSDVRQGVEGNDGTRPFATVLLREASAGAFIDVWVADHVTHKTVVRRVGARGVGESADQALALAVVELMRASLVEGLVLPAGEAGGSNASTTAPAPPLLLPPDVKRWTGEGVNLTPAASPLDLGLGAAGVWGGPDLGFAAGPTLRVDWTPSRWSIGLLAVGPAFGARTTASEGSATLRQELLLVEGAVELLPHAVVRPYVSMGAGSYHLHATGYAAPGYTSEADDAWAALLAAGAGIRAPLAQWAFLILDAQELFALPRPVVAFAAQDVAVSMRPGTLVSLWLEVALP